MFRRILFWTHLVAGLIAGVSIAIMCFTGTVLAFEKQIVSWSERDARRVAVPAEAAARLPLDTLLERVRTVHPDARPASIVVSADPRDAVAVSLGRDDTLYVNPYTGEIRRPASTAVHDFMHVMVDWHRYLALSGDQRPTGKLINGICNLAFFALAVTGVYLWMPRNWSWRSIRAVAFLNLSARGKARDFNWHNVIGLWSAPILIVLTLTAVPISFRWGNDLVYRLVGEEPPVRGPAGLSTPAPELPPPPPGARPISREAQFAAIQNAVPDWQQITLRLAPPMPRGQNASAPRPPANAAPPNSEPPARVRERPANTAPTFVVKRPAAWPRTATTTLTLDPFTGDILRTEGFSDLSTGRQIRSWTRFLHTGEALGWGGQLIAGLASLGGCILAYTGFALAWRRFFGRKS